MLLVQRFADLALSTLRLGFVAQLCGVTEPAEGEDGGGGRKGGEKKNCRQQSRNNNNKKIKAGVLRVFSPFVANSSPPAHVNGVINFMTLFKFTPKNAP